jgi:hypothetical protein
VGFKSSQAAGAHNIMVNNGLLTTSGSTEGFTVMWNDLTPALIDTFMQKMHDGYILHNILLMLYALDGKIVQHCCHGG